MSDYIMAGSAILGAYGSYQSGQYQKEFAEKQAAVDREKSKQETDFSAWKAEQEAAMNADMAEQAVSQTTGQAERTYSETVTELRRKAAAMEAKGGASGFRVSAGSFMPAIAQEYAYGETEAEKARQATIAGGELKGNQYRLSGKINLEEEKLARAGYNVASEYSLLKEDAGAQAYESGVWGAAGQLAKGAAYYQAAKEGKSLMGR